MGVTKSWEGMATWEGADPRGPLRVPVRVTSDGIEVLFDPFLYLHRDRLVSGIKLPTGGARLEYQVPRACALFIDDSAGIRLLEEWGYFRRGASHSFAKYRNIALVGVLLLALAALTARYSLELAGAAFARFMPYSLEEKIGKASFELVTEESRLTGHEEAEAALQHCLDELLPEESPFRETHVAILNNEDMINAFALPGGYVVVTRGLLSFVEREAELTGVLAHELGHVHERHGMQRLGKSAALGVIIASIFGDPSGLAAVLVHGGAGLASLRYDRGQESRADDYAMKLLKSEGLDPEGLPEFFERLSTKTGDDGVPGFLSTHPEAEERIATMQKWIADSRQGGTGAVEAPAKTLLTPEQWGALKRAGGSPDTLGVEPLPEETSP